MSLNSKYWQFSKEINCDLPLVDDAAILNCYIKVFVKQGQFLKLRTRLNNLLPITFLCSLTCFDNQICTSSDIFMTKTNKNKRATAIWNLKNKVIAIIMFRICGPFLNVSEFRKCQVSVTLTLTHINNKCRDLTLSATECNLSDENKKQTYTITREILRAFCWCIACRCGSCWLFMIRCATLSATFLLCKSTPILNRQSNLMLTALAIKRKKAAESSDLNTDYS